MFPTLASRRIGERVHAWLHALRYLDLSVMSRLTAHLAIIALTLIAVLVSGLPVSILAQNPTPPTDNLPPPEFSEETAPADYIPLSTIPLTIVPKRQRRDIAPYTVAPGDTVSRIASRYGISADSVLWANSKLEDNPDLLAIGQTLNIPPTSGVLYTVAKGDTLDSIAKKFKANVADITGFPYNQQHHTLQPNNTVLNVGQWLMVPGGEKPYIPRVINIASGPIPATAARGTGNMGWPTNACVTQGFYLRHPGFDLAAPKGTPVYAADSGYVVRVGWDTSGYGNMILINHGNNFATRYAHLSAFYVEAGQSVKKGDLIGRIGSTGHSTGPHLHFEVIWNGTHRNPSFFIAGAVPARCAGYRGGN
jgi:murein DD-endopeptidase MepM/ murein hydrolase activator NlpD